MAPYKSFGPIRRSHVANTRPFDFLYDPTNHSSSLKTHYHNAAKARSQPNDLQYVAIYPHIFSGLPRTQRGHFEFKDGARYPYHMDFGYPKPLGKNATSLAATVRGRDRWETYTRPNIPHFDGDIQYLDYNYPLSREVKDHAQLSTNAATDGLNFQAQNSRHIACQTDYRAQSAQTDPAELGTKMKEVYHYFDTVYPKNYKPFTNKTMNLVKRGLRRKEMQKLFKGSGQYDAPEEQMKQFERLEHEKWEYLGKEMQEHMEDKKEAFIETIQQSQQYLAQRIDEAKQSLESNQQQRFDAEMSVIWYDVHIWRRYYNWKHRFMERTIYKWQTNPADVDLMKQASEAFGHDARRYFPKANQGDIVTNLTWDNKPDYYMDTWQGFSEVLKDMDPSNIRADIYLPRKDNIYGPKGYVKRKFKEAARFEAISFDLAGGSLDDSNVDLIDKKKKRKPPALLRPKAVPEKPRPMLSVPPLDVDQIETFRAAVIIQKLVKGRTMQKMIQTGIRLRKALIDEVRGNVALTDRAKIEMKQRYEEMQERGRAIMFHRYRMHFIESFLSSLEAQIGTEVLREKHYELVRQLEFNAVDRWKRFAETQRRMRESHEAGRRQQDYRRYMEQEATVQLFQQNHHIPAERAVLSAVHRAEQHLAKETFINKQKSTWENIVSAEAHFTRAMTQQEKETFIASMVYSVLIPDVHRRILREHQNLAMESRRMSIHDTLFGAMSQLTTTMQRQSTETPTTETPKDAKYRLQHPKILPTITPPIHRLDRHGRAYQTYIKRRLGMMRAMDVEYNFAHGVEIFHPLTDYFRAKYPRDLRKRQCQVGLQRLQHAVNIIVEKQARSSGLRRKRILRRKRPRYHHRFDRIDRARLMEIADDPNPQLNDTQQAVIEEMFAEEAPELSESQQECVAQEKRKNAREKASALVDQTNDWLQEQVDIYRQNQVRPYDLPPLRSTLPQPPVHIEGNTVSLYDVDMVSKLSAVTLTAHTTGEKENDRDDVVTLKEINVDEFIPKDPAEDEHVRARIIQAKLNH
ncbi:cilia- and flagella-associated protein 91-like [Paramacrobiotus metropolitanus]|uniref:cilia- and flagella-associated protein 91-like n=1 Tax=Paramacrobiotus metropolitanus TaxID=2943436 RepID=UPI002445FC17|nr:cilia- and flagella-associated protein 91-like [Paramacrobiotus metropolitanus]XP_055336368.1 cilia- and flagella-associated protein 91-like [Paramacrobiotus metropolitanus]